MLKSPAFYSAEGELTRAALLIRNVGFVAAETGPGVAERFGAEWAAEGSEDEAKIWVPPTAQDAVLSESEDEESEDEMTDSDEDSDEDFDSDSESSESSESESGSDSDDEKEKTGNAAVDPLLAEYSPEDPLARIHLRDAERTFAEPAHRARLIKLLRALSPDLGGDYHQALAAIVGLLILCLDTDDAILATARRLFAPKYNLKHTLRAESILMAVDGYIIHSLLPTTFPAIHAQLQRHGILPETYYQRIRIAAGVGMLPFRSLFPSFSLFLKHGVNYLYALTLALFAHLKPRLEAAKTSSEMFILLHLDPEAWGADKEGQEEAYLAFCDAIVESARLLVEQSGAAHQGIPEADSDALNSAWSALKALDIPAKSAEIYATQLQRRLERKWKDQRADARRKAREEAKKAEKKAAKAAAKAKAKAETAADKAKEAKEEGELEAAMDKLAV